MKKSSTNVEPNINYQMLDSRVAFADVILTAYTKFKRIARFIKAIDNSLTGSVLNRNQKQDVNDLVGGIGDEAHFLMSDGKTIISINLRIKIDNMCDRVKLVESTRKTRLKWNILSKSMEQDEDKLS